VAAAKAIPGYDPDEPSGKSGAPVITVIVTPCGGDVSIPPDERFLETVRRHVNALRPICTRVKVIGPRHVSISVFASVKAHGRDGLQERLREAAESCFGADGALGIGDPIIHGDVLARLRRVEGVYKVERLEFRRMSSGCYLTPNHDAMIPRNAIAHLGQAQFDIKST
jgi:hypothetical protein